MSQQIRFGLGDVIRFDGDEGRLHEIFATCERPSNLGESTHFVRITNEEGEMLSIGVFRDNAPNASIVPRIMGFGGILKAFVPTLEGKVILPLSGFYRLHPELEPDMEKFIAHLSDQGWEL